MRRLALLCVVAAAMLAGPALATTHIDPGRFRVTAAVSNSASTSIATSAAPAAEHQSFSIVPPPSERGDRPADGILFHHAVYDNLAADHIASFNHLLANGNTT